MKTMSRIIWAAAGLAVAAAGAEAGRPAGAVLRVRLYNIAAVPPDGLARVKTAAAGILHKAGVEVEWQNTPCLGAECLARTSKPDLLVSIRERDPMGRAVQSHCLGFAELGTATATVILEQAALLEGKVSRWDIVGASLAHEVGHLLFGDGGHSRRGIMRATWTAADMLALAQGQMTFLEEQRARLIAAVRQVAATRPEMEAR